MSDTTAKSRRAYRRPASPEAREKRNAYMRRYRAEHPDKTRAWREAYIMRTAARLAAADPAHSEGGADE